LTDEGQMNGILRVSSTIAIVLISLPVGGASLEPSHQWKLLTQNTQFCNTCLENCNKTAVQDADNCQANSIRNPRFDFNTCIATSRTVRQLCLQQCCNICPQKC
jgi:hypothetical protein